MIHVVLAGGRGTRFWPLSRDDRPKQLVQLWDDESMLQATARRLRSAPSHDALYILAPESLRPQIQHHLPQLPDGHFLTQPAPNGTLPAICLAVAAVSARHPQQPVGLFPADHYIGDTSALHAYLDAAAHHARDGALVTLGIEPDKPETEYGYIHRGDQPVRPGSDHQTGPTDLPDAFPVLTFEEKPDRPTAESYLASGGYLWNSGMFVASPDTILDELERCAPNAHPPTLQLEQAFQTGDAPDLSAFQDIPSGSFDSDVVEQARHVRVIPAKMDWSDVGQWSSVDAIFDTDDRGNTVDAPHSLLLECSDSVVVSRTPDDRMIAGADLDGMVIVDTADATLIVPREHAERVRDIVDRLERDERNDLLEWADNATPTDD